MFWKATREEVPQRALHQDYYVSHASAMDLHEMVTQPRLVVYTTTARAIRPRIVLGTEFRFVRCKPEHLFGVTEHWVTKSEKVRVSDLERTIVDGLKHSEYCGGFTEVAKVNCLRICRDGPIAVAYPQGKWFQGVTADRVGEVVDYLRSGDSAPHDLEFNSHPLPAPDQP